MHNPTANPGLFVYGSLRDLDVLAVVLHRPVSRAAYTPAWLDNYRLACLADESYPMLVYNPGQRVRGAVIVDLSERDWDRLRFFESDEYVMAPITVLIDGSGEQQVLFFDQGDLKAAPARCWTLQEWQVEHKTHFIKIVRRYMMFFESGDREQAEALWQDLETREPDRSNAAG